MLMPWVHYDKKCGFRDYYQIPIVDGAITIRPSDVDFAIERKKFCARDRELLKEYRGWCHVVAQIACDPPGDCKLGKMTKEIAPYADKAFTELSHGEC